MIDYQKELVKPFNEFLEHTKERLNTITEYETAFRHPQQNVGWHIRDDGVFEIFAGDVSISLDSKTGTIIMNGNHLVSSTMDVNFITSNHNSFGLDGSPLNSEWVGLSPLMFNKPDAVFLTGQPGEGQRLIKVSEILKEKKLFNSPVDKVDSGLFNIIEGLLK